MTASGGSLTGSSRAGGIAMSARVILLFRCVLIAAVIAVLELLSRRGVIPPLVLPAPSQIAVVFVERVQTAQFQADLIRTVVTVLVSFAAGSIAGVVLGGMCWRLPLLRQALEPYLVSLYAMPVLVFYPLLLAVLGLGFGPIVAIASFLALVPVTVNVIVAMRSVSPVLPRLGASLNCSPLRFYRSIMIPAATPIAFSGLRLGCLYAVIGTVAMEFILADRGLGYRVAVTYEAFDIAQMWAMIVAVAALAIILNRIFVAAERRIRRDMA